MEFIRRFGRALRAAKAPIYTDLGTTVAQTASNVAIATGIGGGAPLPKEQETQRAFGSDFRYTRPQDAHESRETT